MTDIFATTPELRTICMILDQLDIPETVQQQHEYGGRNYDITIRRVGLNPSMALGVYRKYGLKGVQHSAPTLFFWNTDGAPANVCDDYKAQMGDKVFDVIQASMLRVH